MLKPLTAALRQRLNVSVAETGHQDLWQRAEIACAAVGQRADGGGGDRFARPTGWWRRPTACGSWIR